MIWLLLKWTSKSIKKHKNYKFVVLDRFRLYIKWHISASAFVTALVLPISALLIKCLRGFCVSFNSFRSTWAFDFACLLQSSFPPCAQEKSFSHTRQYANVGPFLEEVRKGFLTTIFKSLTWFFWRPKGLVSIRVCRISPLQHIAINSFVLSLVRLN